MKITRNREQNLNHIMIALADPTRRKILQRLMQSDARVTDLARPFAISLNSVSKHIRILERAQLVQRTRIGREHILHFNLAPFTEAMDWILRYRGFWMERLQALDSMLQQNDNVTAVSHRKKS